MWGEFINDGFLFDNVGGGCAYYGVHGENCVWDSSCCGNVIVRCC